MVTHELVLVCMEARQESSHKAILSTSCLNNVFKARYRQRLCSAFYCIISRIMYGSRYSLFFTFSLCLTPHFHTCFQRWTHLFVWCLMALSFRSHSSSLTLPFPNWLVKSSLCFCNVFTNGKSSFVVSLYISSSFLYMTFPMLLI